MHTERRNLNLQVGFIDFDNDETDIGLSFAIYTDDEYTDSIILARSTFDRLPDDAERGVRLSYGELFDNSNYPVLLREATLTESAIELACETHRFTLDLSKLEPSDVESIKTQLIKLNVDDRFKLSIDGKETKQNSTIALCWYQPEEWEKLKQNADDAIDLDDTYKEWKKNANDMIRLIQSAGRKVQKINVNVDELEAWC